MPTICELKIEAKAKGLKGYSKLRKDELMKLLKPKTTKATSANLKALGEKEKKKVLAIGYKEPVKEKTETKSKKGTIVEQSKRIIDIMTTEDPYRDDFFEIEEKFRDKILDDKYDVDKAKKMTESKKDVYNEKIMDKAQKMTQTYTLNIMKKVVKKNMKKSDKDIIEIFMKEF